MIYIFLIILCITNLWLLYLVEELNDDVILMQESIKEKEGEKNV